MRALASLVVVVLVGCGGDDTSTDAGTAVDAGDATDAGTAPADGGDGDAAGDDAGTDAGPPAPRDPFDGIGMVELVADRAAGNDFRFLEGPAWWAGPGVLIFSDIPASTLYQLTPPDTVEVFRNPSNQTNGNAVDTVGALLSCEHAAREVSRTPEGGGRATFVARWMGMRFNSPNDLVVRSDGTVYFTDPPYGLMGPREIPFNGLFRVDPGGAVTAEWMGDATDARPNGVALSPAQEVLYLADTAEGVVRAFDVMPDGSLTGERMFASGTSSADGMAMDATGNLYVTTGSGVQVFAADGTMWGTIDVPQRPANCGFGDADRQTLYITARTGLYRVRIPIPGA